MDPALSNSLPSRKALAGGPVGQAHLPSSRALESPPINPALSNFLPSRKASAGGPVGQAHLPSSRALESLLMDPTLSNSLPSRIASASSWTVGSQSIVPAVSNHSLLSSSRIAPESSLDHHHTQPVGHAEPSPDDSLSDSEKTSSESERTATEVEHEEGWGATNSRQVTHPGMFHLL
jgi:hypothetical protein